MKLRKGISVVIGRHTYTDEIEDMRFDRITAKWSEEDVRQFMDRYGISKPKEKKQDGGD